GEPQIFGGAPPGAPGGGGPPARWVPRPPPPPPPPRPPPPLSIFLPPPPRTAAPPENPSPAGEPLYGPHYLPRKFKVGLAHPTDNSIDLLTQDIGLMPVDGAGEAWDLYSGGGLGQTHNNTQTAPLLGLYLGRIERAQVVDAVRAIAILQRDHGERRDRKLARWKYTIRRLGLDAVKKALRETFGVRLADATPVPLPPGLLHLGFGDAQDGTSWYGISVENGRIKPPLRK